MIAFLGTGLLGGNFVRAMLARGEAVHVWNRTPARAQALAAAGARAFDSPAEAVRGAERVHLCLVDDATVDEALERARPGLGAGAHIIDHTTTAPAATRVRVAAWTAGGFRFLHAPVFMGPPNALNATGLMLASGDPAIFEPLKPHLEKMTGTLVYLGPDPAHAAGLKLLGNHLLIILSTALSDTLSLARGLGLPQSDVGRLLEIFNPGAMMGARLQRLLTVNYADPSWTLAMARKDLRLMQEGAAAGNAELVVAPAIAASMEAWLAAGHGADDWTVITSKQVR